MEIRKMIAIRFIKPYRAEWTAPIVFELKKDWSLRFEVDYGKLNSMKVRDSWPVLRMDECINPLGEMTIFSKLDASCDHRQVEAAVEN